MTTKRPGMGKNCLLTLVPSGEALPDRRWAAKFNAAATELVKDYTNRQTLPFSVTDAAANAELIAHQRYGYNLRATMVAPKESMGYAGAGSVWYQANVATKQYPAPGVYDEVDGPRLAVAFLAPAV